MEQVSVDKVGELSNIIGTIHKIFYGHKTL